MYMYIVRCKTEYLLKQACQGFYMKFVYKIKPKPLTITIEMNLNAEKTNLKTL